MPIDQSFIEDGLGTAAIGLGLDPIRIELLRRRNAARIAATTAITREAGFAELQVKRNAMKGAIQKGNRESNYGVSQLLTENNIYIYDWNSFFGGKPQPSPGNITYVTCNFVPTLKDTITSNLAKVASPGRNNPYYHFMGSEDTLTITLDWIASRENRSDVLENTAWIKAMAKVDGYSGNKKPIGLFWGANGAQKVGKEYQLYQHSIWLIEKVETEYGLYHKAYNNLPTQAYQTLDLVRIAPKNYTFDDLMKPDY